jgi:hypothetical protein
MLITAIGIKSIIWIKKINTEYLAIMTTNPTIFIKELIKFNEELSIWIGLIEASRSAFLIENKTWDHHKMLNLSFWPYQ